MKKAEQRLHAAQENLEKITNDTKRLAELSQWLQESVDHLEQFSEYYYGKWSKDRENSSFYYPVMGEDAPYEAIIAFEESLRRLAKSAVNLTLRDPKQH